MSTRDEIHRLAEQFVIESHQKPAGLRPDGFTEREHLGGNLMSALADELSSALSRSDHTVVLVNHGTLRMGLANDASFVRLSDDGTVASGARAVELLRAEPDIRALLNHLDVALVELNDPSATAGAMLVRAVRATLEDAMAGDAVG